MYGKPAAIHIICLVAQEVEKLRIHHGYNEVESVVRVGDNDKEGGFPVPPPNESSSKSSVSMSSLSSRMSNGAKRAPHEIKIDLAVLPVATCQGRIHHF